jgi:hypothetical protein
MIWSARWLSCGNDRYFAPITPGTTSPLLISSGFRCPLIIATVEGSPEQSVYGDNEPSRQTLFARKTLFARSTLLAASQTGLATIPEVCLIEGVEDTNVADEQNDAPLAISDNGQSAILRASSAAETLSMGKLETSLPVMDTLTETMKLGSVPVGIAPGLADRILKPQTSSAKSRQRRSRSRSSVYIVVSGGVIQITAITNLALIILELEAVLLGVPQGKTLLTSLLEME